MFLNHSPFSKPKPLPVLFLLGALVVLIGLGLWQMQRLHWKEALIRDIEAAQNEPPLEVLPKDEAELPALAYRNVSLSGKYLYRLTLHRAGAYQGLGGGYYLLTPLQMKDGNIILVNRGFVAGDKKAIEAAEEGRPEQVQNIHGVLRPAREHRPFMPDNQPDRNVWVHEDISGMEKVTGKKYLPLIVEEIGTRQKNVYPIPNDNKIQLRNDHLGYAMTWFGLAVVAVIMFGLAHRKKA